MNQTATTEETQEALPDHTPLNTPELLTKFNSFHHRNDLKKVLSVSGLVMLLVLPVGVIPRLMQNEELAHAKSDSENEVPVVSVVSLKPAPARRQIILPGAIEAVVETPVYARATGYINQRFVDIGDRVNQGQRLAHIDTPEIDQSLEESKAQVLTKMASKAQFEANRDRAKADLDKAIAELSQAKASLISSESDEHFAQTTYLRFKKLGDEGAVSKQDVDEKETRLKMAAASRQAATDKIQAAESEVIAMRARLQAEGATVKASSADIMAASAHAARSYTEKAFQDITSPFEGVVTERNVDSGMLVSAGSDSSKTVLFRIARIDTVKVFIDVPQYASSLVRVGQSTTVSLKEFPGKVFKGTVARTSVALDPTARTLRTEVHVANPGLTLAPGMYADVSFSVPRTGRVFLIPANALVNRSSGPQVLIVAGKKVHYKNVVLGDDLGGEIEIVGGVSGKEKVIVNPPDSMEDGTRVAMNES